MTCLIYLFSVLGENGVNFQNGVRKGFHNYLVNLTIPSSAPILREGCVVEAANGVSAALIRGQGEGL